MLHRQPQTIAPTKNRSGVVYHPASQVQYRSHSYDTHPGRVRTKSDESLKSHLRRLRGACEEHDVTTRRPRVNDVRPASHIVGGVVKSNAFMAVYAVILQEQ